MATSSCLSQILILCCLATALLVLQSPSASAASGSHDQRLLGWAPTRSRCRGTIAECLAADDQDESDSEIGSRRILSSYVYISYGALQRNTVPCSQRGASYYNCYGNGAQANPYTRGCTAITRCRS